MNAVTSHAVGCRHTLPVEFSTGADVTSGSDVLARGSQSSATMTTGIAQNASAPCQPTLLWSGTADADAVDAAIVMHAE